MTVVFGTAGHIDHGKTTLLRALTGIDADRLPEERRRGMTIDVGYAHLVLDDGGAIDFVDVPGHDRLVGNMLVGAGEIDAVMLVVAADDGPRAQTLEHLALLDALGVSRGLAVITKTDAVAPERVTEVTAAVERLLGTTSLAAAPIVAASGVSGAGVPAVRAALERIFGEHRAMVRPPTLGIDRIFSVKGRGVVVTGSLRGGPLAVGDRLRIVPGGSGSAEVRIREIQIHGAAVDRVDGGGRTALNLAGVDPGDLHRGGVLTADPAVVATDRILVAFGRPIADRTRGRIHAGTAAADAAVGRNGRDALALSDGRPAGIVRAASLIAMRAGDRFVLRRGPTQQPVGGVVLDPVPPRGISRRRQTTARLDGLAAGDAGARLDLHGALVAAGRVDLAHDVAAAALQAARSAAADVAITTVRSDVASTLRRIVTLRRDDAATAGSSVVDRAIADGALIRDGDRVHLPGAGPTPRDPAILVAMDRLEALLAVPAPPALAEAARIAGCPPAGIRDLERADRIVILAADLAYAASTYRDLTDRALRLAAQAPLTPATFRDATGTSRRFVMAILEDLDRRALLRRTANGHVPGPRAPR
jgi:selenocysteine-specific elongation factor